MKFEQKTVDETLSLIRETYPNYVITFAELEEYGVIVVRLSTLDFAVTVIKDEDTSSLEEVFAEVIKRIECLENGEEYNSGSSSLEKAANVLRMTLQEIGFDRAVSLLEKLNKC
jgi:hypothetical protein